MRFVAIDLETTGSDPLVHNIIEFGAVIEDTNNVLPLHQLPRFKCYLLYDNYTISRHLLTPDDILPEHRKIYEKLGNYDKQKRAGNYKMDDLYIAPRNVGKHFKRFLSKFGYPLEYDRVTITGAGKNFGSFDFQFINYQLPNFYNHVVLRQRCIDPSIMLMNWQEDSSIPTLSECLERCDVEPTVAHETISDCLQTIQVLRTVTKDYQLKLF